MITVHRQDNSPTGVTIMVTKAKPKSVAKLGNVEMAFDRTKNKFYWDYNGERKYASEKYFKPIGLQVSEDIEENEPDEIPF